MSAMAVESDGMAEGHLDAVKEGKHSFDENNGGEEYVAKENGVCNNILSQCDSHDQLVQMVIELNFQNEYLKAQFEGLKNLHSESSGDSKQTKEIGHEQRPSEDVNELHEKIEALNRELLEQKQTQNAAEEALKHLRAAYTEADAKAQELATKLAEAQQKMDHEIKERDDKYNELDSKFGRLHKRAKQRIQDVQKEKDDLEARLRDVNEKAERASSQQSSLQQELERTRQQANEARKAMDVERQQLRTANNKLRDSIEEMRRSMEAKEKAFEGLQHNLFEKEQMLEEIRGSLQTAEEKRLASIAELSAKHQKHLESLEAQLADALADRSKAAETISSLQVLIAEKESKIAEMDAASTGEAVRLKAAVESAKGELAQLKDEHEKEKGGWEAASQALKAKLEVAESTCLRSEIEAAKMRSQLELELSMKSQLLNTRDTELMAAKEEISRLESEFSSYKVRAHALLQKKDAELSAAKDSELLKAQEEAVKEAEREIAVAYAERDRALQDLQDTFANYDKELAARDAALSNAEQRIRSIEAKLESANGRFQSEKEAWQRNLEDVEETWRLRCKALETQNEVSTRPDLQKEFEELKLQYIKLKEEHDSFRDIADRMIEEKDKEISRLVDQNKNLHQSLLMRKSVCPSTCSVAFQKQDAPISSTSAAEQQILILARQQAQREEELAQSQRHILALQVGLTYLKCQYTALHVLIFDLIQEELEELERENRLHSQQQEAMLKAELRDMERMQKREGVDMTYLKNVILKLLETGEVEALLPVIGMLLQFSPQEIQKCQQAYRASTDVPPSPGSEIRSLWIYCPNMMAFSSMDVWIQLQIEEKEKWGSTVQFICRTIPGDRHYKIPWYHRVSRVRAEYPDQLDYNGFEQLSTEVLTELKIGDSQQIVSLLKAEHFKFPWRIRSILLDCKSLMTRFAKIDILFVPRDGNRVAHLLAREAISSKLCSNWSGVGPPCIESSVVADKASDFA
ncbi:GRIP [Macleaya cordata]|uniref:GRIP n=1 Tax=Macleaya cordata TaxID=56857 RepID=A0A200R9Z8_MACCD|nr:GRIP [Macleaya cordata]